MNIYPQTLAGIAAFVNTLDGVLAGLEEREVGFTVGGFPLYDSAGDSLGSVEIDEDQHPYFVTKTDWDDNMTRVVGDLDFD